jgi:hypothetical protein
MRRANSLFTLLLVFALQLIARASFPLWRLQSGAILAAKSVP